MLAMQFQTLFALAATEDSLESIMGRGNDPDLPHFLVPIAPGRESAPTSVGFELDHPAGKHSRARLHSEDPIWFPKRLFSGRELALPVRGTHRDLTLKEPCFISQSSRTGNSIPA